MCCPWQNRQFFWLRISCWNGNPEHQVSGQSSKHCSLIVAAQRRRQETIQACREFPLQKSVNLSELGSLCQVRCVPFNSGQKWPGTTSHGWATASWGDHSTLPPLCSQGYETCRPPPPAQGYLSPSRCQPQPPRGLQVPHLWRCPRPRVGPQATTAQ